MSKKAKTDIAIKFQEVKGLLKLKKAPRIDSAAWKNINSVQCRMHSTMSQKFNFYAIEWAIKGRGPS